MQEIVDGARSEDLVRCTRAWEVVLLVAQDALVSPREERFGASNQVGGKVPTISVWRLDFIVVGDSCSFSGGSFPFCQAEEAGHQRQ